MKAWAVLTLDLRSNYSRQFVFKAFNLQIHLSLSYFPLDKFSKDALSPSISKSVPIHNLAAN